MMASDEPSRVIKPRDFLYGHTLSFSTQPYLGELFTMVRTASLPFTVVVGAGVSMNAGLRSWPELIRSMANQVNDRRMPEAGNRSLREMARLDQVDLMRKAELILHLVKSNSRNREDHEIIRDALYEDDSEVTPGQIAISIARLAAARDQVRLITTNFDMVLEKALGDYFNSRQIRTFSLSTVQKWRELPPDKIGVLHVHGVIQQRQRPKRPIVLTESQFFKHGADVRKVIFESVADSCSVFVGLGMSDPNLVGPLYELSNNERRRRRIARPRFALVVPEAIRGANGDSDSAIYYALESAKALEKAIGLKPIILKSYSQLNQVISDLSLAIREPANYVIEPGRHRDRAQSLVYGDRLTRALDECYSAIGCHEMTQRPIGVDSRNLSERLNDALHAANGPVDILRRYAGSTEHTLGGLDGENFALFLWLRSRNRQKPDASYSLNLVGTSAYVHREEWLLRREVDIRRSEETLAAQAVFHGSPQAGPSSDPPWDGIFAVPIVVGSRGTEATLKGFPLDVLTVGAITLNSNFRVVDDSRTAAERGEGSPPGPLSIIAELDAQAKNDLLGALQTVAQQTLFPS